MCAPNPPKPPSPQETAGAQTAQNIGTPITQQQLNNVNQVTPYGNLTYDKTGTYQYTDPNSGKVYDIPTYTATQTLSDDQQTIHDQNQQTSLNLATLGNNQSGRLDDLLSRPMDLSGLPERGDPGTIQGPPLQSGIGEAGDITRTYGTDFSEDRQRVESALMERLNPSLERDRSALEARLASQGIRIGSEAYNAAMDDFGRQSNDARVSAILGAGQEQSRLASLEAQRAGFENAAQNQSFQQSMSEAGFNNQTELQGFNAELAQLNALNATRNEALNEKFAVRNQPINEITALMSGAQVQNPNFVTTNPAQVANTDFAGIQANYNNNLQKQYESQMSGWNQLWGERWQQRLERSQHLDV